LLFCFWLIINSFHKSINRCQKQPRHNIDPARTLWTIRPVTISTTEETPRSTFTSLLRITNCISQPAYQTGSNTNQDFHIRLLYLLVIRFTTCIP
jgi:hypothetical protein